jgi:hypothetical protein
MDCLRKTNAYIQVNIIDHFDTWTKTNSNENYGSSHFFCPSIHNGFTSVNGSNRFSKVWSKEFLVSRIFSGKFAAAISGNQFNFFFQNEQPWVLKTSQPEHLSVVLHTALVRIISTENTLANT